MGQRPPVAGVVAAEALARALEQVADEDAGREPVPVVPRPAVLVRERREEQRRVGDAAGDHDVGALRERVDDRARAEVRRREQRRAGERRRTARRCRGARTPGRARCAARRAAPSTSSPTTVAILMPVTPELARGLDRGVRGRGRVDAARVGDDLRAAVGDERQRTREVRGKVARVAARLVALAVLLQDRERQLGERFEAEVVDAFGEQRVDGRRACRRRSPARPRRERQARFAQAWTGGLRSAHGCACSSCAATRSSRSSRPYAAMRCTPIGRLSAFHVQRQRDRGLAGHVRERRERHERRGAR